MSQTAESFLSLFKSLHDAWLRRWWKPEASFLSRFAQLSPVVVITGGSEGVGFALAKRFMGSGSAVS